MWLALRLIVRLVGVVALCLVFAVAWAIVDTHRSIDRETSASADRVAAQLEILYWRELLWRGGLRKERLLPTPEWQTLATLKLVSPGVCVAFAPGAGEPTRLCGQVEGVGAPAPVWFKSVYEGILGPQAGRIRALTARQADAGSIFAVADPEAAVRQAWMRVSTIADFAAAMALAIFVFAALAIAHTLAPTAAIVAGLRQLSLGDYRRRLPPFRAREFALIGCAVNDLADRLGRATAERIALTRRLIEVRDDERKQMARELHDEFGQCLTATVALASAIEAGARTARSRPRRQGHRGRRKTYDDEPTRSACAVAQSDRRGTWPRGELGAIGRRLECARRSPHGGAPRCRGRSRRRA
jgi:hypothetical protein